MNLVFKFFVLILVLFVSPLIFAEERIISEGNIYPNGSQDVSFNDILPTDTIMCSVQDQGTQNNSTFMNI